VFDFDDAKIAIQPKLQKYFAKKNRRFNHILDKQGNNLHLAPHFDSAFTSNIYEI